MNSHFFSLSPNVFLFQELTFFSFFFFNREAIGGKLIFKKYFKKQPQPHSQSEPYWTLSLDFRWIIHMCANYAFIRNFNLEIFY